MKLLNTVSFYKNFTLLNISEMKRIYFSRLIILIALFSGWNWNAVAQTTPFSYTGAMQTYVVPAGCSGVTIDLAGGQGGTYSSGIGGKGGRVQCNLAVTPGETLYVYVGQAAPNSLCGAGGLSSGGGENGGAGGCSTGGTGGGGGTDVRTISGNLASRVVVGGGGGGGSWDCAYSSGGGGGYPAGGNAPGGCSAGGSGGSQTAGGAGTCYCGCGATGALGTGGGATYMGGGGGGGYYGGGGSSGGAGGGGSSYAGTGTSSVAYTNSFQPGNGYVNITPLVPTVNGTPASIAFPATLVGSASIPLFTALTGAYMGAGPLSLSVTGAPAGVFTIATDANPVFANTQTLAYTPPVFSGLNVYVSFNPAAVTSYSATLVITGGGLGVPVNIPITGNGVPLCSGTPTAGVAIATPNVGNSYTPFTLSLTPAATSGGLSYQWQTSTTGSAPWNNISGAVLPTYSFTGITVSTYYRCIVTCTASGLSATSAQALITATGLIAASCTGNSQSTAYCCNLTIGNTAPNAFFIPGPGTLTDNFINSASTGTGPYSGRYIDFTGSLSTTQAAGTSQTCNIGGAQTGAVSVQMWVDWNNNGTFDATETVGGLASIGAGVVGHPILTIPAGVAPGIYRMRVVMDLASGNPVYPSIPPCPPSSTSYFDNRDYTMVIAPPPCSGTPVAGITAASQYSSCAPPFSFTPTLINVGQSTATGVTYNWQSAPSLGGPWTNVSGATGALYTPNITTTGVYYYRNSSTCAGSTGYSSPVSVSLNPTPTPITGTTNLCTGVGTTLTSTPTGGNWTSSNSTIVTTLGTTSGFVTGAAAGTATISYTLATGCYATYPVTVNTQPAVITGPSQVCVGATPTYTDSTLGGTWSSGNPTVASIGGTSGLLNALLSGTTIITYTSLFFCSSSMTVTVNPLPGLFIVSGGGGYCVGSLSTYSVILSGSQVGVTYQLLLGGVPVGPAISGTGGILNFGIQSAPGIYTVVATNTTTGCTRTMVSSATIVVNTLPALYSVSGGGSYCSGVFSAAPHIFLSGSQAGVNYKLYNGGTLIGTVPGSGGVLDFGACITAGCYTVVATNGSGCSASMIGSSCVTINTLPTAYDVTPIGGGSYCIGGAGVDVGLSFSNTGVTYKLYRGGSTLVTTLAGTGGALDFGMQTIAGTYTVTAINATTGCTASMNGAATIVVNPLPNVHNVITLGGGSTGSYCAGGTGVDIWLDGSDGSVNYQLYLGIIPVGVPVGGTGLPILLGTVLTPGTYTVVATDAVTGCVSNMSGSVTITVNPLPPLCVISSGGNFCVGSAGVPITMTPSTPGMSYQLYRGGTPLGLPIIGTGGTINFGIFTTVGIYTIIATDPVTGCTRTMTGIATISTNPPPTAFNVTGTGSYCVGGPGLLVGLDFSATGITYQLYRGTTSIGGPVTGTGAAISFGYQTVAGTYTVIATNVSTSCFATMNGSAVISINPMPSLHLLTGGGSFCAGDTGRHIILNGSETGVSYQLMLGLTPIGSTMPGSGSVIDFGLHTVAGTYTVIATDNVTGCNRFMTGGIPINVNPLPTSFLITGGGMYCAGTTGVHIGLSGSVSGILYQLYNGTTPVGVPVPGSGFAIDFGIYVVAGTYSVVATNTITGCQSTMTGFVTVATSALPTAYTVTGTGSYCAGGSGLAVGLNGSDAGIDYKLYRGTTLIGSSVPGTGSDITFGTITTTGIYTVVAVNSVTGCTMNMTGNATISINSLPNVFPVTGGGNYCAGGAGFHVYLTGSNSGINYQLYDGTGAPVGAPVAGSGSSVDFGLISTAGTYTAIATNATTGCVRNMPGSATININPLPALHNVTGGGGYCTGGVGVNIGLDGSNAGINYQLFKDGIAVGFPVAGTGFNINFGLHTATGVYTVVANNTATLCTSNMTGSVSVSVNSLPAAYTVTGGGPYCATATGSHVFLSGSDLGVDYQLWNGTTAVGIPVAGTGSTLDFGPQTIIGAYSVTAVNATTTCGSNMTGSVSVSVLPVIYPHTNITPSITGIVCVGQTVNFTAAPIGGGTGPTYQWRINSVNSGIGTSYSYIPNNGDIVEAVITSNYMCAFPTVGHDTVVMNVSAPQMPSVSVSVNPGDQICTGGTASFTATTAYGGTAPNLKWIKNGAFVASGSTYAYVPNNGDIVTFMMASNFPCRLADTVFSSNTTLHVQAAVMPVVTISVLPGNNVAAGTNVTFSAMVTHGGTTPLYQWVVNSTPIAGATNSSYSTSTLSNNDSVTCMVEGSCGLVGFNSIGMKIHSVGVGVGTVANGNSSLTLLPNPNKGEFTVKGSLISAIDQVVTFEVTDVIGQVVYSSKVKVLGGNVNEHITLDKLSNGMYLFNLRSGNETSVFHFVIEQ